MEFFLKGKGTERWISFPKKSLALNFRLIQKQIIFAFRKVRNWPHLYVVRKEKI